MSVRCTARKHVAEKGQAFCDCGALMLGLTAAKNARVVTILDSVQRDALTKVLAEPQPEVRP